MPYKNIEDRRAQRKRWKKQNPDKVREQQNRFRSENRELVNEREREYYNRTRPEQLVRQKQKRQKRIDYLHEQLGDCCCNCHSKLNLEFDHINPALKLTRTPPQSMGVKSIQKELDNLQVLCKNCHVIKTRAQKAAAWHLFCQLTEEEQTELTHQFEHHTIKPKS